MKGRFSCQKDILSASPSEMFNFLQLLNFYQTKILVTTLLGICLQCCKWTFVILASMFVKKSVLKLVRFPNPICFWTSQVRHNPGRLEFFHLALLGYQNIKTSLTFHKKIIGLDHFLFFLAPSERNYNLQSLWITLYSCRFFPPFVFLMIWSHLLIFLC